MARRPIRPRPRPPTEPSDAAGEALAHLLRAVLDTAHPALSARLIAAAMPAAGTTEPPRTDPRDPGGG